MKFQVIPLANNAIENVLRALMIQITALNVGNIESEIIVTAVRDILTMASIRIVKIAIFNVAPV
jgi:hypothetical protein